MLLIGSWNERTKHKTRVTISGSTFLSFSSDCFQCKDGRGDDGSGQSSLYRLWPRKVLSVDGDEEIIRIGAFHEITLRRSDSGK